MHIACEYGGRMPNLQVRNVPEHLHQVLKAKAASDGSTLSDFLRTELEKIAQRPTVGELRERLRLREPIHLRPTAARAIRELRDRS